MVKWTVASLEWIFFDTEDNRNSNKAEGAYPYEAGIKHPTIYYCYYRGEFRVNQCANLRLALYRMYLLCFKDNIASNQRAMFSIISLAI